MLSESPNAQKALSELSAGCRRHDAECVLVPESVVLLVVISDCSEKTGRFELVARLYTETPATEDTSCTICF